MSLDSFIEKIYSIKCDVGWIVVAAVVHAHRLDLQNKKHRKKTDEENGALSTTCLQVACFVVVCLPSSDGVTMMWMG